MENKPRLFPVSYVYPNSVHFVKTANRTFRVGRGLGPSLRLGVFEEDGKDRRLCFRSLFHS